MAQAHYESHSTYDLLSRLEAEHAELEADLNRLNEHVWLTPAEEFKRKQIKKLKLLKKDRIALLRAQDSGG